MGLNHRILLQKHEKDSLFATMTFMKLIAKKKAHLKNYSFRVPYLVRKLAMLWVLSLLTYNLQVDQPEDSS